MGIEGAGKVGDGLYLALDDIEEASLPRRRALMLARLIVVKLYEVATLQAAKQILVGRCSSIGQNFFRGGVAGSVSLIVGFFVSSRGGAASFHGILQVA